MIGWFICLSFESNHC